MSRPLRYLPGTYFFVICLAPIQAAQDRSISGCLTRYHLGEFLNTLRDACENDDSPRICALLPRPGYAVDEHVLMETIFAFMGGLDSRVHGVMFSRVPVRNAMRLAPVFFSKLSLQELPKPSKSETVQVLQRSRTNS